MGLTTDSRFLITGLFSGPRGRQDFRSPTPARFQIQVLGQEGVSWITLKELSENSLRPSHSKLSPSQPGLFQRELGMGAACGL